LFVVLSVQPLNIQLPYYDFASDMVLVNEYEHNYVFDGDTGYGELSAELNKIAWLNYNNPDWKLLIDPSSSVSASGTGVLDLGPTSYGVGAVVIDITGGGSTVDKWYGSPDFGIYGAYVIGDGTRYGQTRWINLPSQIDYIDSVRQGNSVRVFLKKGVTASVTVYSKKVPPGIGFNTTSNTDPYIPWGLPTPGVP
jgi:hypothetical protein